MLVDQTHVLLNRKVFTNTISNYLGKIVNLVTWFFLTPFILNHLGGEIYGLWILVGSLVAYGSLFDLGIASAVTKYVAEYTAKGESDQAQKIITTSLSLYSGLGLIVFLISLVIAPFFPTLFHIPQEQHNLSIILVVISGLTVGLSIPSALAPAILRGLQRFDLINLINIIGTLFSAVIMILVILNGGGVLGLVLTSICVNLLMQVPNIWSIHRIAPQLHIRWRVSSLQLLRQVTSFSLALFVLNVNGYLETKTDELVIGGFLHLHLVTSYNISLRLSSLPQMLTAQLLSQILPLASTLHANNDKAKIQDLYISSTRFTLALFIPVGLFLCILAEPILRFWVGPAYASYNYLVVILCLASFIDTSQWPAGLILQGMAQHKLLALVSLLSGITNLILSLVLVRWLGLIGVAIGTLIPTTIICFFFVLPYSLRLLNIRLSRVVREVFIPAFVPAFPAALVLFIFLYLPNIHSMFTLILAVGMGTLVYGLSYLSLKSNIVERESLQKLGVYILKTTIRFLNFSHIKKA